MHIRFRVVGTVSFLALAGCVSNESTRGAWGATSGGTLGASRGTASAEGGAPGTERLAGATRAGTDSGSSGLGRGDESRGWDAVPRILSRIVAPTFPNVDCDVTHYGGVGDATTDNTRAFAKAIADCSSRGGGRVVVPAGMFATGPIELLSHIDLHLSAGATLKFSTDATQYLPVVKVSWEGSLAYNYHPLVWAHDATDVAITGAGTLDGNASTADWYAWSPKEGPDQTALRMQNANGVPPEQRIYGAGHYLRPSLIEFMNCVNVLFDGFTAKNSPFWTIHPVLSKNITARGFRALGSFINTDGFNPEACTDVLVRNATIQVDDDAVALKAGRDRDGWTYYRPTENVVIQQSTFLSKVGGVTLGSEMSGGVRNVYIEDTTFSDAAGNLQYAIYIKAAVTRGGFVENLYARRLTVATVSTFLNMTGHYVSGAVIGSTNFTTFNNINIDTATVARTTGEPFSIAGADVTRVATGIHLSHIKVTASAGPALSAGSGHYSGLTASNVVVNGAPFNPPASAP
jgi:polygalacturonase